MHMFVHKSYIAESINFYQLKQYSYWFIRDMIIPDVCVIGADVSNDF